MSFVDLLLNKWTLIGTLTALVTGAVVFVIANPAAWAVVVAFWNTKLGRNLTYLGGLLLAAWGALVWAAGRGEKRLADRIEKESTERDERRDAQDVARQGMSEDELKKESDKYIRRPVIVFPFLLALLLAGCTSNPILSNCSGWRAVDYKESTRDYLLKNDRETLEKIIGNNQNGEQSNCW